VFLERMVVGTTVVVGFVERKAWEDVGRKSAAVAAVTRK